MEQFLGKAQVLETEKGAIHARIWRGQNTQVELTQNIT